MKNLSIGLYLDHAINLENISEILQRILQLKKKINGKRTNTVKKY